MVPGTFDFFPVASDKRENNQTCTKDNLHGVDKQLAYYSLMSVKE